MSRYSFEQFAAVRNHANLSFSPDGKWVTYTTNISGQFNVWRQPVARSNEGLPQMPVQLTSLVDDTARTAVWSPDGARILTTADFHGNENFQLYEVPAEHGWLYPLTDNPEARHEISGDPFSPDGRYIAYGSNERNPADFDIKVRDLKTGETRILLSGDAMYFPAGWSPAGDYLLVVKVNTNTDQDLYLLDVQTGNSQHLTPHDGEVKFLPGPWHPGGERFYIISDQGREFQGLAEFDIKAGEMRWLETHAWDVDEVAVSKDGRYLGWLVNEDGYSSLYVRELASGDTRQITSLPTGVYHTLEFSPDEALLGLYIEQATQPADLYILDLETDEHWPLTQSFLGGVLADEMVVPELVRYPTHDGREIPAYLYKPKGVKGRVPVVLSVHGGPEAQELPRYAYNGFYQYLLSLGIGILAPNIRGSTGYGKSYQKLIHRDWGGAELKDLEYAAKYLQALNWVDADKVGVYGGSFGGFATLSCVSRLPDYWAAAVDIVGPANLITFTKSVPPFWRRLMKVWVGDPEEDAELLTERSPLTYVDDIRAPLLVIQGANDPRVVKAESDQMVERLEHLGREVEYLVFEDEGHGFTKRSNSLAAYKAAADWLETHLKSAAGG